MTPRPSPRDPIDGVKAQETQIEGLDECIDHPHRVVFVDVVLQPIREKKPLRSIRY